MYLHLVPLQNTVAPSCRSIEDFEIIEQVGEGHLSAVLHCVDVRSGIHVAVKSYHKDRMNLISSRQVLFTYLDKTGRHACTNQQHVFSLHPSLCFLMPSILCVATCCNSFPKGPSSVSVRCSVCQLIYVTGSVCPADKAQLAVEGHPAARAYPMCALHFD